MISKEMYKVLKVVPVYPKMLFDNEILKKVHMKTDRFSYLFKKAWDDDLICCKATRTAGELRWYLSEDGVVAVEEYHDRYSAAKRSTIALVISGLSLLASIIAIVVSYVV